MFGPRFFSLKLFPLLATVLATLALAACTATTEPVIGTADGTTNGIWPATQSATRAQIENPAPADDPAANLAPTGPITGTLRAPVRVAILAPQSGPNAALGEALVQAAQLAVFDLNESNFMLVPKDTLGTPEGTRAAVSEAAAEGATLILGPLFAQEVEAAKSEARARNLNILAFSTDWRQAGENVYSMGVLPFGQAQRVAEYASRQGLRRVGVIAPRDIYGDAVLSVFESTAQRNGLSLKVVRVSADGRDAASAVAQLTANGAQYDALFLPVGGQTIHLLASTLTAQGMGASRVRYLGTGLWDDPRVLSDANMSGAVYAAPSPQIRATFERNYQRIYGAIPPRLASIGYDAAALAVVLARNAATTGSAAPFDRMALTNPNGFSGVDGIFRFAPNGLAERGMAILQIAAGVPRIVEAAPATFQ